MSGEHPDGSIVRTLLDRLFRPVDVATLAVFRVLFGAIMAWEVWRYFDSDWIRSAYIDTPFHFTYFGFSWVRPWPGDWMYVHFAVVGIAGLFVMVGLLYRVSAVVVFVGFTYWFLLDQARYLNHFYLVSLISFIMIFVPAHRALSIDARIWQRRRADDIPAWPLWILRGQIGLVYFFAAVAKMNGDWLRGEPVRMWLAKRDDYTLLGPWLPVGRLFDHEWFVYAFAYGGLLFDLLIAPALLWRRTRPFAIPILLGFHLTNNWLFDIGIFPWFMIASTVIFLEPGWPRRVFNWPRGESLGLPSSFRTATAGLSRHLVAAGVGLFLLIQVLVPLRHFLYPGNVHWTEEGHRFSWHMKLRNKSSRVRITARDPASGQSLRIPLRQHLSSRQIRKMGGRPDMTLQFCRHIAAEYDRRGVPGVEVYADVEASLNGRPFQQFLDPEVNLAAEPRTLWPASWILPLRTPLQPDEPGPGPSEDPASPVDDD